jgi:hypothetical protein
VNGRQRRVIDVKLDIPEKVATASPGLAASPAVAVAIPTC